MVLESDVETCTPVLVTTVWLVPTGRTRVRQGCLVPCWPQAESCSLLVTCKAIQAQKCAVPVRNLIDEPSTPLFHLPRAWSLTAHGSTHGSQNRWRVTSISFYAGPFFPTTNHDLATRRNTLPNPSSTPRHLHKYPQSQSPGETRPHYLNGASCPSPWSSVCGLYLVGSLATLRPACHHHSA